MAKVSDAVLPAQEGNYKKRDILYTCKCKSAGESEVPFYLAAEPKFTIEIIGGPRARDTGSDPVAHNARSTQLSSYEEQRRVERLDRVTAVLESCYVD